MERRRHKRHPNRLAVRFGENDLTHTGVTRDVSLAGCYVVTDTRVPSGQRVHLQLFTTNKGEFILLEGVVTREQRLPADQRPVVGNGFGVRFLSPIELFGGAEPGDSSRAGGASQTTADDGGGPRQATRAPAGEAVEAVEAVPTAPPRAEGGTAPTAGASVETPATLGAALEAVAPEPRHRPAPSTAATARPDPRTFAICYATPGDVKRAWEAELRHGGVFVATSSVFPPDTAVTVLLDLPFASTKLALPARVIQSFSTAGTRGLGLAFAERRAALASIQPFSGA